jgi:hypothetical protein
MRSIWLLLFIVLPHGSFITTYPVHLPLDMVHFTLHCRIVCVWGPNIYLEISPFYSVELFTFENLKAVFKHYKKRVYMCVTWKRAK